MIRFAYAIADVAILICLGILGAFIYSAIFDPSLINAVGCMATTDNDLSYSFCMTISELD